MFPSFFSRLSGTALAGRAIVVALGLAFLFVGGCAMRQARTAAGSADAPWPAPLIPLVASPLVILNTLLALADR